MIAMIKSLFKIIIIYVLISSTSVFAATYKGPRTRDGKPDLNGVWQVLNNANWNLQTQNAKAGFVTSLGARGAEPGGLGVVVGEEIPYLPDALVKRNENYKKRNIDDPEIKCFLPGVPRATYMPFPFQISQSSNSILITYEFASATRTVYLKNAPTSPADFWMGHSKGKWQGDTLVVDVSSFNDQTWFDRSGNFHSEQLHVVEKYTPIDQNHIDYEATITDQKIFSRPWKITMPIYRRIEKNARLMDFNCVEFAEELMYGHLKKTSQK